MVVGGGGEAMGTNPFLQLEIITGVKSVCARECGRGGGECYLFIISFIFNRVTKLTQFNDKSSKSWERDRVGKLHKIR